MNGKRQKADRLGRRAEFAAMILLVLKGYRILFRRYKAPVGEVDIIARRGHRIAFVEVKGRADPDEAFAAVRPKQRQRIKRAADHWLARRENDHLLEGNVELGFDIITISPWRMPHHYCDAFSHDNY